MGEEEGSSPADALRTSSTGDLDGRPVLGLKVDLTVGLRDGRGDGDRLGVDEEGLRDGRGEGDRIGVDEEGLREGAAVRTKEGVRVGFTEGGGVGFGEGAGTGLREGAVEGAEEGRKLEGARVGVAVLRYEGFLVEVKDGDAEGATVGDRTGAFVGLLDGCFVAITVGVFVGTAVGVEEEGRRDGALVGEEVGR